MTRLPNGMEANAMIQEPRFDYTDGSGRSHIVRKLPGTGTFDTAGACQFQVAVVDVQDVDTGKIFKCVLEGRLKARESE